MGETTKKQRSIGAAFRRNLVAGILTAIPIAVTVFIVRFVAGILAGVGLPLVAWLEKACRGRVDWLANMLDDVPENEYVRTIVAVVLVVAVLVLLGWIATKVIGRWAIMLFDWVMDRIPLVKTIYGSTKKLLATFQKQSGDVQNVVLIDFPSPEMKTVGLVTRTFDDATTGRKLAAVYVPTTPNPTSGYLEIVPVENITETDWTVDEAMTFIVSGGAVAPERMAYDKPAEAP